MSAVLRAISSLHAVRRFRADPVATETIESIVYHASCAPSGGNRQPWEFICITDRQRRSTLADIYRRAAQPALRSQLERAATPQTRRIYEDALQLTEHLAEAPVHIVVCAHVSPERPLERVLSSIYPAVQNLMLAAHAYGLGTVLTTLHKQLEAEVQRSLDLPPGLETACLIPLGYPERRPRTNGKRRSRRPVSEILHWERFQRGAVS